MSMIKNPLTLNVYLILMIADKMATIFNIDATEDLNDSFSSYISLCKSTYRINIHIGFLYLSLVMTYLPNKKQ